MRLSRVGFSLLAVAGVVGVCSAYDAIQLLPTIPTDTLERPSAVAAAGDKILVLDEKKGALFFGDGAAWLQAPVEKEVFDDPEGLAVGPDGKIYVADTGNHRVVVMDAAGRRLGAFGAEGGDAGRLSSPRALAVGADGRVYVADTGNDRVSVFTADGIYLFSVGEKGKEPGRFLSPIKVAVDRADELYVLDKTGRLQKFDSQARLAKEIKLDMEALDVAVDAFGFIYILAGDRSRVVELSPEGVVLGKFGSQGSGPGQFKKPRALAETADGTLLVLDPGNKRLARVILSSKLKKSPIPFNNATKMSIAGPVSSWEHEAEAIAALGPDALYAWLPKHGQYVLLDGQGKAKKRFGGKKKEPSATKSARGLAASAKLGLFVSDNGNHRLQRFALDGTWQANVGESSGFFDSRTKEGRMKDPHGVAVNDQGTVYVADTGNRRIDAFNPEGVFLFGVGPHVGTYELQEPAAVAWDPKGFLYFTDKGLKRVFLCEPSGALIATWGGEGSGPGQFKSPSAISFDGRGTVYVLDDELRRVSVFTREGKWLTDFFAGGEGEQELLAPAAIVVEDTRLVIADPGKKKIVSFKLKPQVAAPAAALAVKEGIVSVSWDAVKDPWARQVVVARSTAEAGPWAVVGSTAGAKLDDIPAEGEQAYFYRVAVRAESGDVGPWGRAMEIFVPRSTNRPPLEISTLTIGNIFSANYKWYLKNPVGSAVLVNNVGVPFENVKVSFRLKDFMDFGTDAEIKRLSPGQSVETPLMATFNNRILDVTEDTPIQAELSVTYFEAGQARSVSIAKPLRVYSRNAITWDKPERIANFITPKDPPVLEFAREALRTAPKLPEAESLNANLAAVAHLWGALSEAGVAFFTNPNNPYEKVSEDPNFPVDYTQFPRETLKRKSGQCDDLVTLLISMLEGAKVRAQIVDYPGHMALMFDTEKASAMDAGLPEDILIAHEGTQWVPLEATMIGKPLAEAVRYAARSYHAESARKQVAILDPRKAWQDYEPATLPEGDAALKVPEAETRVPRLRSDAGDFAKLRYAFLKSRLEEALKADAKNVATRLELGYLEFEAGKPDAARAEYLKALEADPGNTDVENNLGNLSYFAGDYAAAEVRYLKAAAAAPDDADLWMNAARAARKLKKDELVRERVAKALSLDPDLGQAAEALLKDLQGGVH